MLCGLLWTIPLYVFWGVLWEYVVSGSLLQAISLYNWSESCLWILSTSQALTFFVDVRLSHVCVLSLILFVIFMDTISQCSRGVKFELSLMISGLDVSFFADDVALLFHPSCDLQYSIAPYYKSPPPSLNPLYSLENGRLPPFELGVCCYPEWRCSTRQSCSWVRLRYSMKWTIGAVFAVIQALHLTILL